MPESVVSAATGMEISVVMPCLNEEKTIGDCVRKAKEGLDQAKLRGEVVVCDNGSTDCSVSIAEAAGARVVLQSKRGYGNAYLKGIEEARGKFIVMADSDGTYDFADIGRFIKPLKDGHDFVMGSRLKGTIEPGAMPWSHRWIGVPCLTWLLNRISRTAISDAHCGMRSFTKEAFDRMQLISPGMEFASEMIFAAAREKLRIAEEPIRYMPREGKSKLHSLKDGWRHLRFMLLYSPTLLFLAPGSSMLILGLLAMLTLVWGPLVIGSAILDINYMIVASLLALLGFQVLSLGLYAKSYSVTVGFTSEDGLIRFLSRQFNLERGIVLGSLVALAGLGILAGILYVWVQSNYGFDPQQAIGMLRRGLLGMSFLVLGVQTIFSSFFLSLIRMPSRRQ